MKKIIGLSATIVLLSGCGTAANEESDEIMVMAAASLTDALDEIKALYEDQENVEVTVNYGSSGQLRQQIAQGAPADLFLSASLTDMEQLEGEVRDSTNLLVNQLVFIATPEAAQDLEEWEDLLSEEIQGIAMGQTDSVPAGRYALQAFESLNMWDEIEGNAIYGKDVRQVLTYVETGNADAGVVYQTDALASGEAIEIIAEAPEGSHDPILYPIGLLDEAGENEVAKNFYEWLQTEEPMAIFESYGFNRS